LRVHKFQKTLGRNLNTKQLNPTWVQCTLTSTHIHPKDLDPTKKRSRRRRGGRRGCRGNRGGRRGDKGNQGDEEPQEPTTRVHFESSKSFAEILKKDPNPSPSLTRGKKSKRTYETKNNINLGHQGRDYN
jgi:hypothetical protein